MSSVKFLIFLIFNILFFSPLNAQLYSKADTMLVDDLFIKALNYSDELEFDSAIMNYQQALNIIIEIQDDKNQRVVDILTNIGFIYVSKEEFLTAKEYFLKASSINEELFGEYHSKMQFLYCTLGLIYSVLFEWDNALLYFLKEANTIEKNPNENQSELAKSFLNIGNTYYNKGEYFQAAEYFQKSNAIQIKDSDSYNPSIGNLFDKMGDCFTKLGDYHLALENFNKAFVIYKQYYGENNPKVAEEYIDIAVIYREIGEYNNALNYLQKADKIYNENPENYHEKSTVCFEMGSLNYKLGNYDLALAYYQKSLKIDETILPENHPDLANIYNNIGIVYGSKKEYDLALEYYQKALTIFNAYLANSHPDAAIYFINISGIYRDMGNYYLALEYAQKALDIHAKFFGENHPILALDYNSIGLLCIVLKEYDFALKFFNSAIAINKRYNKSAQIASNYNNIGLLYKEMGEFDLALKYYEQALKSNKEFFGEKHPEIANNYNNIATIYSFQKKNKLSLKYFQYGLVSNFQDFNEFSNIYKNPIVKDYLSSNTLLNSFIGKAQIFNKIGAFKDALSCFQLCDTLLIQMRKTASTLSDKITFGETSFNIYEEALNNCYDLLDRSIDNIDKDEILAQMVIFSERSKAGVLLEAISGQESLKFSGIPDSILKQERSLKVEIYFLEKTIAEASDSIREFELRGNLFKLKRQYDRLIAEFETNYPDYYNLKYSQTNPTIVDIQKFLNDHTLLRSYFVGDSCIYILNITKNAINIEQVNGIENLPDSIIWFRSSLKNTSSRQQENYLRLGHYLFQKLFPDFNSLDKNITDLIIIPDGNLSLVPYETLLTESYQGNIDNYKDYPFMIKKFTISYSYSANLFYQTFSNEKTDSIEITKLNDWIAYAPVFDNLNNQTLSSSTRELQKHLECFKYDSMMTNRYMFDRSYISSLPATKIETEAIFKIYKENNLKAKVLINSSANERSIKSGELENYKSLHFATHGFVNSERPELSGILLAQDSTGDEDGILYSGEIYNLKLNADLVVLSACETGLGKIQRGEGIIGLTRALLYAGAKNIVVSLWQVADESTSELMVDFYKNSLEGKITMSYSEALRNAKLKMISEGKYAHPLFWSPFILIGR